MNLRSHLSRLMRPTGVSSDEATPEQGATRDAHLIERFRLQRDAAAFAELVLRHGPLVRRVCARSLNDPASVDDAFQATFLILARRADTLHQPERLVGWLHGVATRVARKAAAQQIRAPRSLSLSEGSEVPASQADPLDLLSARELLQTIDDEVARLPEVYRLPVVLCCLEGLSLEEAAAHLGWSHGSVKGRLERGRQRLHQRLQRRGLTLSSALASVAASTAPASVSTSAFVTSTSHSLAQLACSFASSAVTTDAIAPRVLLLTHEVLKTMTLSRWALTLAKLATLGLLGGTMALTGWLALAGVPAPRQRTTPPQAILAPEAEPPTPLVARDLTLEAEGLHSLTALAFTTDSKTVLTGGLVGTQEDADGIVLTWDRATGKRVGKPQRVPAGLAPLEFSRDARYLLLMRGLGEELRLLDRTTGKSVRLGEHRFAHQQSLAADGSAVLTNSAAAVSKKFFSELKVWDATSGKLRFAIDNSGDEQAKVFYSTLFLPDGKSLLVARGDGAVVLLDSTTGKETERLATLPRTAGLPLALVDETGKWAVASTTEGKEFTLVDLSARKAVVRKGHDSVIRAVGFVPGGKRLITCDAEASLRVWEHGTDRPVKVFKSRDRTKRETAQEIRVSADGRWAAVSTSDEGGLTWVWDLTTGREVASYAGAERVVFSPDGQMLAIHLTSPAKPNASPEDKPTAHRVKLVPVRDWEAR